MMSRLLNIYKLIALLFFLSTATVLKCENLEKPLDDSPPSEKRIADFNEEELNEKKIKAIQGDADIAYQIFLYYLATSASKTGIEGFEWLIIAVKNKHPKAIESFKNLKKQGVIDIWMNMLIEPQKKPQDDK